MLPSTLQLTPKSQLNTGNLGKVMNSYVAVVLRQHSHRFLLSQLEQYVKGEELDWLIKADHMTLHLGKANDDTRSMLGKEVVMYVSSYGRVVNRVLAVKVGHAELSERNTPLTAVKDRQLHITISVNLGVDAKSKESNDITHWNSFDPPLILAGVVTEITKEMSLFEQIGKSIDEHHRKSQEMV